jgi:hypothetical protein
MKRQETQLKVTGRRKELQYDLFKREETVNWYRKHYIPHCGEFASEEAIDLSQGRTLSFFDNQCCIFKCQISRPCN